MNFIFLVPSMPLGGAELQVSYMAKYINSVDKDNAMVFAAYEGECDKEFGLDFMQAGRVGLVRNLRRLIYTFLLAFKIFSKNDVLIIYNQLFMPLGLLLKLARMKVVYSVREYDERVLTGWRFFCLKRFDLVFTNTERVSKAALDKGFRIPTYLNYFPFSDNATHVGSGSGKRIVIVSNVQPHKNIHIVIKAMVGLDFELDVLGKTDNEQYLEYCKKLAADSGIVVNFRGFVKHEEVLGYLRGSDLFLHPSSQEGTSNAILSAVDVCIPVLVSDIPENRSVLGSSGCFFEEGSVSDLKEKILTIESRCNDICRVRYQVAEKFSLENMKSLYGRICLL